MSGTPAIEIENLGKRYRLGENLPYQALRENLSAGLARPIQALARRALRQPAPAAPPYSPWLWAVRDLNVQVQPGEVLGIIGHNGAGKSTLLKLLARITRPTEGCTRTWGRVGSLLEVGTGFHPELTGRENIYLSGAILGMRKREIDQRYEEIVAFAEVDRFLDTPVKRYSSGMFVRLAFAVAAHLQPEILIVDEVLAVGDASFQKKCLGKMGETAHSGRTVLFVSHNLNSVERLCTRAIWLKDGRLVGDGKPAEIIRQYQHDSRAASQPERWLDMTRAARRGSGAAQVTGLRYSSLNPRLDGSPTSGGPLEVELQVRAESALDIGSFAVTLYGAGGTKLVNADILSLGRSLRLAPGENRVRLRIHALHLKPGEYSLGWWLANPVGALYDFSESALDLTVIDDPLAPRIRPEGDGVVACDFDLLDVSAVEAPAGGD
jgi:lipopolysaccharide transport system ATP-binding protein